MTVALRKRFWTAAHVTDATCGFGVALDGRALKSPAKSPLETPTRALAQAIVDEWNVQGEFVDPGTMPATRRANDAIDRVRPQFAAVVEMLGSYAGSDLLCYRAEAPHELVQKQNDAWDPLLRWADETFKAPLNVTAGLMPVIQPEQSVENLTETMHALSDFQLTGFHDLVTLSGSLVIALAVIAKFESPENLWQLSRVDETWQAAIWGSDDAAEADSVQHQKSFLEALEFYRLGS